MNMSIHPLQKAKPYLLAASICLGVFSTQSAYAQIENLPVLGDSVSGTITTQQEYEFGREIIRSMRAQSPLLNDPLIEEYIASLSYHLAANSELTDHRLEFLLIDSDQLNAFAAPGGIVGINAGLFIYADNEGQFASVVSHELAHLSQRHYARRVAESQSSRFASIATALAGLLIVAAGGAEAGQAAIAASQAVMMENRLQFSRGNEEEADRVGMRTLFNAGFDPEDMPGMFENMMQMRSFSRQIPEFLSSHPLSENRVADSRNRALGLPAVEHIQNVEFLLMKQRALLHFENDYEGFIENLERDLPQLNGAEADAAIYGIAIAQLQRGEFVAASETLSALLRKDPNRISYVVLEAEIAKTSENYEQALTILEENLDINPNNYPLSMTYAQTLDASNRYAEAITVYKELSQLRPSDTNIWYELAELQGLVGDISGVHQARAEYFYGIGELGRALEHLNSALLERNNSLTIARINQRLDDIQETIDRYYR
ncbi:M48 family metalloprotease [Gammaproteobacteria bacterium]|jgi:beta-barrel assembly-enhancing protease|nr:M48 family metalloprotease [Gammaproteobacteria bacterium]